MSRMPRLSFALVILAGAGCSQAQSKPAAENDKNDKGIFGKKTQEIGQFDPNKADQVVSDSKIRAGDPITAPLSAYGPMMEKISNIAVDQALAFFNIEHERYPASH